MKIAFPTQEDKGLDSEVYGHFGSAANFVIVDLETGEHRLANNPDQHHLHGQCQPLKALDGNQVDAVIVGGIGGGALNKLTASGIKVYRASQGTVAANMDLMKQGRLEEFTPAFTCAGHTIGGGCHHH